jgi:hypothetical protein
MIQTSNNLFSTLGPLDFVIVFPIRKKHKLCRIPIFGFNLNSFEGQWEKFRRQRTQSYDNTSPDPSSQVS